MHAPSHIEMKSGNRFITPTEKNTNYGNNQYIPSFLKLMFVMIMNNDNM